MKNPKFMEIICFNNFFNLMLPFEIKTSKLTEIPSCVAKLCRNSIIMCWRNDAYIIYIYQIDHPQQEKEVWKKCVSIQRKRAVIACFRQTSLHMMPRYLDSHHVYPVY